jgi:hypothetical protein
MGKVAWITMTGGIEDGVWHCESESCSEADGIWESFNEIFLLNRLMARSLTSDMPSKSNVKRKLDPQPDKETSLFSSFSI